MKFVSSRITAPPLDAKSKEVFSGLTEEEKESVYLSYASKIRSYSLSNFTESTAECVKLLHSLELYSKSQTGEADGCTASQTEQHKDTKTEIMKRFIKALDKANIPEIRAKEAIIRMRTLANVKKMEL